MAEKDSLRPGGMNISNACKVGVHETKSQRGFWPTTEPSGNVPSGLCARVYTNNDPTFTMGYGIAWKLQFRLHPVRGKG